MITRIFKIEEVKEYRVDSDEVYIDKKDTL